MTPSTQPPALSKDELINAHIWKFHVADERIITAYLKRYAPVSPGIEGSGPVAVNPPVPDLVLLPFDPRAGHLFPASDISTYPGGKPDVLVRLYYCAVVAVQRFDYDFVHADLM